MHEPVQTGITYHKEFVAIKALKHVNASLQDIRDFWEDGTYDDPFMQMIVQFYYADVLYESHTQDAIEIERSSRIERERAKAKNRK